MIIVLFLLLATIIFPYGEGEHVYLSPNIARVFEFSVLIYFVKSIRINYLFITLCFFVLVVLRFKGIEYGVYTFRMILFLFIVTTRSLKPINLYLSFFLYTIFLIFRLSQGIKEPGLFMEFNLEGILWVALVIYIFNRISPKIWAKFFLITCILFLLVMDSKALVLALSAYIFFDSHRTFKIIVLGMLSIVLLDGIDLTSIDRFSYWVAYYSYFAEGGLQVFIPIFDIEVQGNAGEILNRMAPGNYLKHGYSTSPGFHAYLLRILYDYGLILGFSLIYFHFVRVRSVVGPRLALSLGLLGFSTNFIFSGFFLLSLIILENARFSQDSSVRSTIV